MALSLNEDGFKYLEAISRDFVWGSGEYRDPKVLLVAWDIISEPALSSGLAILNFCVHVKLLKLRYITQLIQIQDMTWVRMAELLIKDDLHLGPHKKERKHWSPSEALLLGVELHTASKTVNCILEGWKKVERKLTFISQLDISLNDITAKSHGEGS